MARDYATIRSSFWNGGTGKELRGDSEAQIVALYLLTCDSSCMSGIYKIALSTVSKETGVHLDMVYTIVKKLTLLGFLEFDDESDIVWVPNLPRYQVGASLKPTDKRRTALIGLLKAYSHHPFVVKFFDKYGETYDIHTDDLLISGKDIRKGIRTGCPFEGADVPVLLNSSLRDLKSKDDAKTDHAALVDHFFKAFRKVRGCDPGFNAIEGKAVKSLLKQFGLHGSIELVDVAFQDDFYRKSQVSLDFIARNPNRYMGKSKPVAGPRYGRMPNPSRDPDFGKGAA